MTDEVSDFKDFDPEDAWDRGDEPDEQLRNLVRRALLLERRVAFLALLDALAAVVERARERDLDDREQLRARDLDEDIVFVRGRI